MKSSISEQSNLNPSLQPQSEKIPSDFWKTIRTNIKSQHQAPPIKPVPRSGNLTLSFAQERLWFLDQLQPDSSIHNMRAAFCLKGALNVAALEQSLAEIVRRHEILRTTFSAVDGMPVQVISPYIDLRLPVIDAREVHEPEREIKVQQITRQEFEQPFDLEKAPLWRFKLLRLAEEEHVLLRTVHHIIFDGWSYSVFMRELAILYEAFSTGKSLSLKNLPIQYADFAQSQRQWLQGEVLESQLNYWKQQLSGSNSPLELPIDHPSTSIPTYRGARQILVLPKDLTEKLKALSAQEGVSLFVTLLAAFKTLLYCYTEQDDMIICSPIAGRNRVETKKLIGFFNNILPMRTYLGENPSFRELMGRVSQGTLGAYEHQDVPFQKIMDCSNIPSTPLCRGMFALQNTPSQPLKLGEINISYPDVDSDTSNFDLFLSLTEDEGNITGGLTFKTDLFNSSTITQMLENFQILLQTLVANPNQRLSDLPVLRVTDGFRIEFEEIHAALMAHKAIKQAVVLLRKDQHGIPQIVAYWIAAHPRGDSTGSVFSSAELRTFLAHSLPDYMLPAAFVRLEALPLTPNGKLDRKALPTPFLSPSSTTPQIQPSTSLQQDLLSLWQEVLGRSDFGIRDNFFELGGHSLMALPLLALIENHLHQKVPLSALFHAPTVETMSQFLCSTNHHSLNISLVPIQPDGDQPPIFAIHILGKGLEYYRPLARELGHDYPLWGLSYGLAASPSQFGIRSPNTITELAAHYIEEMRTLQPQGPYTLLGFSASGLVAYEMAKQLEQQGHANTRLILLDASHPIAWKSHTDVKATRCHIITRAWHKISILWGDLHILEHHERWSWTKQRINYYIAKKIYSRIAPGLMSKKQHVAKPDLIYPPTRCYDTEFYKNYDPRSYRGTIILFKAQSRYPFFVFKAKDHRPAALGWENDSNGGVETYSIHGDHCSILTGPGSRVIAKHLRALLDRRP